MELTDRKKKILRAIVDNYIKTAEPVGSKVQCIISVSKKSFRHAVRILKPSKKFQNPV